MKRVELLAVIFAVALLSSWSVTYAQRLSYWSVRDVSALKADGWSVRAALNVCRRQRAPARPVTVTGYFRLGPSTFNGPMVHIGAIFERNTVPKSAAKTPHALLRYQGLGFSVEDTSRVARSPILDKIRDYSRLSITGRLTCMGWDGIRLTAIRVASTG